MKTLVELRMHAEAEENIVTFAKVKAMSKKQIVPIGDDPAFVTEYKGMRIVLSIENQGYMGMWRHVSISMLSKPKQLIFDYAMEKHMLKELGFFPDQPMKDWVEKIDLDKTAFNIIQPFSRRGTGN